MVKLNESEIIDLSSESFRHHIQLMDREELIDLTIFMYGYIIAKRG